MDEFGAPSLGDDCFCAVVAPIVGQIGQYHMRAASAEGLSGGEPDTTGCASDEYNIAGKIISDVHCRFPFIVKSEGQNLAYGQ